MRMWFWPAIGLIFGTLGSIQAAPASAPEPWRPVADRLAKAKLAYHYGATDPASGGLDCSGFTMAVFREAYGVELPNESGKQYDYLRQHGQVWDASTEGWKPADLQPGDLVFWSGTRPTKRTSPITHVMIYCGKNQVVGAQNKGHQLSGQLGGVGYYPFHPVAPKGNPVKDDPSLRQRPTIYAYGRLLLPAKG